MIDVPVSSVLTDKAPLVPPDASTVDVAAHLRRPTVPAVLVQADTGAIAGIVTESDVVAVVAERGGNQPVEAIMSAPVVTVKPSVPIGLAADRMRSAGVARLPVVREDGTYEGLVTHEAIAPYLSRHRLEIEWQSEPLSLAESEDGGSVATD
jgi:CBS domain-containing protein